MDTILNLTPHPVTIAGVTFAPSGDPIPRVTEESEHVGIIRVRDLMLEIPVHRVSLGEVTDLPPSRDGVYLIVSRMVAEAARDRTDLVIPFRLTRDDQGRVNGAQALAVIA